MGGCVCVVVFDGSSQCGCSSFTVCLYSPIHIDTHTHWYLEIKGTRLEHACARAPYRNSLAESHLSVRRIRHVVDGNFVVLNRSGVV